MHVAGSLSEGSWFLRTHWLFLHVKAPWAAVYFSERHGFRNFYPRWRWWRLRVERG